jgi:hypothetical protein
MGLLPRRRNADYLATLRAQQEADLAAVRGDLRAVEQPPAPAVDAPSSPTTLAEPPAPPPAMMLAEPQPYTDPLHHGRLSKRQAEERLEFFENQAAKARKADSISRWDRLHDALWGQVYPISGGITPAGIVCRWRGCDMPLTKEWRFYQGSYCDLHLPVAKGELSPDELPQPQVQPPVTY